MSDALPAELPAELVPEVRYFREHFRELIAQYPESFVVIKAGRVVCACKSFTEAFDAGVAAFGTDRFLIQAVVEPEREANFVSRHIE